MTEEITLQSESVDPMASFDTPLVPGSVTVALKSNDDVKRTNLYMVPFDNIKVMEGFNARDTQSEGYKTHIRFLADSIKENGFSQRFPLGGYVAKGDRSQDVTYVVEGHCRMAAVALAREELRSEGRTEEFEALGMLPMVPAKAGTSLTDLTIGLITSNSGLNLSPWEKACVVYRLHVKLNMSVGDICKKLSMTRPNVDMYLKVVSSPKEVADMVRSGELAMTRAVDAMKEHGSKVVDVLKAAQAQAQAEQEKAGEDGKTASKRILPRHSADYVYKKAVKKAAPAMADVIKEIAADHAFQSLPVELAKKITDLITALSAKEEAGKVDDSKGNAQDQDQQ